MNKIKKIISSIILGCSLLSTVGCKSETKTHVKIGLCQQNMLDGTPKALRKAFPNVEFEFLITNNSADYNVYLYEHNDLPDILTIRRFSLSDALPLKDTLVDLSTTDIAANYYANYLQNFTYSDDVINWLPALAEVWGIVANKTLFDKYGIELPTDYDSFISVCQEFSKYGIKGFETDWKYDYSALETLQGFNIELLQDINGRRWRSDYESGNTTGADETLWSKAFSHMYDMLEKTGNIDEEDATSSLITKGYSNEKEGIETGKIAMIRASGADIVGYTNDTHDEYVMLPYFGQETNWVLSYPYYSAAINKNSNVDSKLLMDIYTFMLGQGGQDTLDTGEYMMSYTKDVSIKTSSLLNNLGTYLNNNLVFTRLANNDLFSASQKAVQGIIKGEYDSKQAYTVFDETLKAEAEEIVNDYKVEKSYPYSYQDGKGSESVSAILNTARSVWNTDLAITYAPSYSNSIYEGEASSKNLSYYLASNPPISYYLELTGAQVKSLVSTMLHYEANENGYYGGMSPVTDDMLPVSSGFEMVVKKTDSKYELEKLTIDGSDMDENKTYTLCFNITTYYAGYIAYKANLIDDYTSNKFQKETKTLTDIKTLLQKYLVEDKKQFMEPSNYITLK